nr:DUF167 domain-containing protein [uncultured Marivita sp.]
MEAEAIKVSVTATPLDGKANAAVIKLLSKALGVPKSRLTLVQAIRVDTRSFALISRVFPLESTRLRAKRSRRPSRAFGTSTT